MLKSTPVAFWLMLAIIPFEVFLAWTEIELPTLVVREVTVGEAQKTALARVLYKDSPFMVLDEPTSALDPVSEYEVYSKFNEISGGGRRYLSATGLLLADSVIR